MAKPDAGQRANRLHRERLNKLFALFNAQWPLGLIAALYILSRLYYCKLGVRFASQQIESFWQYLDTGLLKHELWTSLLYLHSQPPLMNLYYGCLLKAFPRYWPMVAYAFNLVGGLLAYLAIYEILVERRVQQFIAMAVVIVAMCNPSAALFEAEPFYTHTVFCLLVFASYFFAVYLQKPSIAVGSALLAILAALVLWRSSYQLAWFALYAFWLLRITPLKFRSSVLIVALNFGSMIGAVYVKDEVLFGIFNSSSGSGMSLAKIWAGTPEALQLVGEGRLSPISSIAAFDSMDKYQRVIPPQSKTGVKAVDAIVKDNGTRNLNNIGYPEVSRLYARDYLRLVVLRPKLIARQLSAGWFDYFRPDSAWFSMFDPGNQSAVEKEDRDYRALFCCGARGATKFSEPSEQNSSFRKNLFHRLSLECWEAVLTYAALALFLICVPFQRWLVGKDASCRQLMLFLVSNIAYSAVLSNSLEVGENMRFRYETQGMALIAVTIMCSRIMSAALFRDGIGPSNLLDGAPDQYPGATQKETA